MDRTGDDNHPIDDTGVSVRVYHQRYEQPRSLQAEEAELLYLMGFPAGSTSGRAVSPIDRLWALGDSWDVHTSIMLNRFSRHATIRVDGPLLVSSPSKQFSGNSVKQALLAARAKGGPDAIVQLLAELTKDEQLTCVLCRHCSRLRVHRSSKHIHTQVYLRTSYSF